MLLFQFSRELHFLTHILKCFLLFLEKLPIIKIDLALTIDGDYFTRILEIFVFRASFLPLKRVYLFHEDKIWYIVNNDLFLSQMMIFDTSKNRYSSFLNYSKYAWAWRIQGVNSRSIRLRTSSLFTRMMFRFYILFCDLKDLVY